jgi:hypothetical protein
MVLAMLASFRLLSHDFDWHPPCFFEYEGQLKAVIGVQPFLEPLEKQAGPGRTHFQFAPRRNHERTNRGRQFHPAEIWMSINSTFSASEVSTLTKRSALGPPFLIVIQTETFSTFAFTISGVQGWTTSRLFFLWLWANAAGGASATASSRQIRPQKLIATPVSTRQSDSACNPLRLLTTGMPTDTKLDHLS